MGSPTEFDENERMAHARRMGPKDVAPSLVLVERLGDCLRRPQMFLDLRNRLGCERFQISVLTVLGLILEKIQRQLMALHLSRHVFSVKIGAAYFRELFFHLTTFLADRGRNR